MELGCPFDFGSIIIVIDSWRKWLFEDNKNVNFLDMRFIEVEDSKNGKKYNTSRPW